MVQSNGEEVHRLNCYDNKYLLIFFQLLFLKGK